MKRIQNPIQDLDYIEKDTRSHDVLNGLNSVKFLEILNSNKTPNIFSPDIGEVNCTSGILYN